MESSISV